MLKMVDSKWAKIVGGEPLTWWFEHFRTAHFGRVKNHPMAFWCKHYFGWQAFLGQKGSNWFLLNPFCEQLLVDMCKNVWKLAWSSQTYTLVLAADSVFSMFNMENNAAPPQNRYPEIEARKSFEGYCCWLILKCALLEFFKINLCFLAVYLYVYNDVCMYSQVYIYCI